MRNKLLLKNLLVKTSDSVVLSDELVTYKMWFNGLKHFYTVKVLPKNKK